jgi:hypothetical protein
VDDVQSWLLKTGAAPVPPEALEMLVRSRGEWPEWMQVRGAGGAGGSEPQLGPLIAGPNVAQMNAMARQPTATRSCAAAGNPVQQRHGSITDYFGVGLP